MASEYVQSGPALVGKFFFFGLALTLGGWKKPSAARQMRQQSYTHIQTARTSISDESVELWPFFGSHVQTALDAPRSAMIHSQFPGIVLIKDTYGTLNLEITLFILGNSLVPK